MAKPQEANPDASAALASESADSGSMAPAQASDTAAPVEPGQPAIGHDLPVVESPRVDAADSEPPVLRFADHAPHEPAEAPADEAPAPSRSSRFALLAAAVALAAGLGSVIGSLSAAGFAHLWSSSSGSSATADAYTLQAIKAEIAELTALKAALDGATRNANSQFAKIADRLDRVERAQADPAKIAHIADTVDRLDKHSAALDVTGSIAASPSSAPEAKTADRIVQDWIVHDVQNGRALVESRYGGIFDVASGSTLPGLGRVESIKRQDGQWVVVTAHGLITSDH